MKLRAKIKNLNEKLEDVEQITVQLHEDLETELHGQKTKNLKLQSKVHKLKI